MIDDLVKRLRSPNGPFNWEDAVATYFEAADRIEKLEAALRKIASLGFWDGDRAAGIARQALEKSNEDA